MSQNVTENIKQLNKLTKGQLIGMILANQAKEDQRKQKSKFFLECGYCHEQEEFETLDQMESWIIDDMRENGHDHLDYTVIYGHTVELEYTPPKVDIKENV